MVDMNEAQVSFIGKSGCNTKMGTYFPDLKHWLDQGEYNYQSLLSLFPDLDQASEESVKLIGRGGENCVEFRFAQRSKYTSYLELVPSFMSLGDRPASSICVRLYHDAKVAEVVLSGAKQIMPGIYPYPNKSMHQVDEKAQLNQLLTQWLSYCHQLVKTAITAEDAD